MSYNEDDENKECVPCDMDDDEKDVDEKMTSIVAQHDALTSVIPVAPQEAPKLDQVPDDWEDGVASLETSDKQVFQVMTSVIKMSRTIRELIEDVGTAITIPLPNIDGKSFAKVIEWCRWHKENDAPEPVAPAPAADVPAEKIPPKKVPLCEWDLEYLKSMENEMLFNVILGANYLDIAKLLTVGCKGIAMQIKGKTPEEIRKIFNITNDFTPEEEERIRKENQWVEEEAATPVPVE